MKDTKKAWLKAELAYVVEYEGALKLTDFFIRRTGMIHFNIKDIYPVKEMAADFMQELLNWDETTKSKNIEELDKELQHATQFS